MLRLTGGEFRGRYIHTPAQKSHRGGSPPIVRPTQARLRQALFNSLQTIIGDAKVLDLFAGSGALGFEALSRGATSVVFVEDNRNVLKLLERNTQELGVADRVEIIADTVARAGKRLEGYPPLDLILADPPYAAGWEMKLLETFPWQELLVPGGIFCLEWGTDKSQVDELPNKFPSDGSPAVLEKIREKNYGDSMLTTYRRVNGESVEETALGEDES